MSESESRQRDPVVALTKSEGRSAKIGYSKGCKRNQIKKSEDILEEFNRAFENSDYKEEDIMRFRIPINKAEQLFFMILSYAEYRKDKRETASAKKYRSIADKIETQLVRQGVKIR